jgi:hypothetical protein
MKALDLEWIVNNWEHATEADRLAAGKAARKQLRAGMTQLEHVARGLKPLHGDPAVRLARVKELRAQGLDLQEAVAQAREQVDGQPHSPEGWAEMRQQIREALDEVVHVFYFWADRCPDLQPAWNDLERRAADLHTQLRIADSEVQR